METLYHQIKFRQGDVHQICNRPYRRVWLSHTLIPVTAWFVLAFALASLAFAQGTPEIVWQADNASKAIAFSPDGKMPISAHDNGTGSVAFSPDGQLLASAGKGGAKLWHVPDMTLIRTIPRPSGCDGVAVVAFSSDGELLAAGGCGVQLF